MINQNVLQYTKKHEIVDMFVRTMIVVSLRYNCSNYTMISNYYTTTKLQFMLHILYLYNTYVIYIMS